MLAPTGNLFEVFRKTAMQVTEVARSSAPLDAEIVEGEMPDWYLVQTMPGRDLDAMHWLARRRFGVFRPMQQRKQSRHEGQAIGVMEPVFPGHLFVFVWGIDKLYKRVLACPGVASIFRAPNGRFVAVNEPDENGEFFIDRLRALGWDQDETLGRRIVHETKRRIRKVGRKERRALKALKRSLKTQGKFDPSTWAKASELAPSQRIALLMQALQGPAAEGGASISA